MNKFFTTLVISLCLVLGSFLLASSDEQLTITTYYPSPYGVYATLRSNKMAVGTTAAYTTGFIPDNDLIVEGRIGIANSAPAYPLDVNGNIAASNIYLKPPINKWVGSMSWCTRMSYGPASGTTSCVAPATYSWSDRIDGSSPDYTIPTSGTFLCCS